MHTRNGHTECISRPATCIYGPGLGLFVRLTRIGWKPTDVGFVFLRFARCRSRQRLHRTMSLRTAFPVEFVSKVLSRKLLAASSMTRCNHHNSSILTYTRYCFVELNIIIIITVVIVHRGSHATTTTTTTPIRLMTGKRGRYTLSESMTPVYYGFRIFRPFRKRSNDDGIWGGAHRGPVGFWCSLSGYGYSVNDSINNYVS